MIFSSSGSRAGRPSVSMMRQIAFALGLLPCITCSGAALAYAVPFAVEDGSSSPDAGAVCAPTRLAQTQPSPSTTPPSSAAPQPGRPAASPASPAPSSTTPSPTTAASTQAPADEPIGNVATLTGTATAIRNKNSLPLKLKDDIYLNDVLVTSANSTLGVTFNDATTFNLTANARITVDNYIYDDKSKNNSALFDITKGTVAFVAAAVAKNGDMKVTTPSASLGIRGTTGLVEVEPGATATSANNIKLYPDADGRVGHIDVNDRSGARLGSLTQGSSGFTVRPGAGGRVTATPLAISPQQAARDQGIVRQVHAAQVVGRQVVTQQRALRQANPNRANPPGQSGPQRQNNLKQRPGAPQQPGTPNRPGQQGQPATPNRPGQTGQAPASPNAPGQQGQQQHQPPGAPGIRQPAKKPAPAVRRPAPPKGKPGKKKP
jgi:FecR protein